MILGSYLHSAVFNLNRSEKGLGYVHGAGGSVVGPYKDIVFYGQADSLEKAQEAVDGWQEVIDQLLEKNIPDETWENYKLGIINSLSSSATSRLEEVNRVGGNFRTQLRTDTETLLAEEVKKVTPDDIYNFVEKYLAKNKNFFDITVKDCQEVLE